MKKAVLYARVSSDLQKKEKTVESQVAELKKQIEKSGDVLVKEYIEEGYTGANLDRPALNELRRDLKKGVFDIIYVLFTDRISREVTKLHIFITEVLIYKKEIVINGKNYINNPPNKFEMTILGAVAELERAKIIERNNRGRQYHLRQGHLLSNGNKLFGYTYFPRTSESYARHEINEREAQIVRSIFDMYARGNHSATDIARKLKAMGVMNERTKMTAHRINYILNNEAYTGTKYFNTMTSESALGVADYHSKKRTSIPTDRSQWIGIKIPAIISKELFDKVQEQLKYNRTIFRNARGTQLLSNLVVCGKCRGRCYACRKAYSVKRANGLNFYQKTSYKCHGRGSNHNPDIDTRVLESCVSEMIKNTLFDKDKIADCMDFFKNRTKDSKAMNKQIGEIKKKVASITNNKNRIIDLYAKGGIEPSDYFERMIGYDEELQELENKQKDLLKRLPLFQKPELVEASIAKYSKQLKERFESCNNFDSWRKFYLDFIVKIEYTRNHKADNRVRLYGSVPIIQQSEFSGIIPSVEFKIERTISTKEISKRKQEADTKEKTLGGKSVLNVEYGRLQSNIATI